MEKSAALTGPLLNRWNLPLLKPSGLPPLLLLNLPEDPLLCLPLQVRRVLLNGRAATAAVDEDG